MKRTKSNVVDAIEAGFLKPGIERLRGQFEGWQRIEARGNRDLWKLLGIVYELAAKVAGNHVARQQLIDILRQNPEVGGNNRWRPDKCQPRELLLVALLGFNSNTKARKSQWLSALKSAEKAGVAPTETEFINWISNVGGVDGARRLISNPKAKSSIRTLAKKVEGFVEADKPPLKIPSTLSEDRLPEGYGLVLVKRGESDSFGIPVATLSNEPLVRSALERFLALQKKLQNKLKSDHDAELKEIQTARRKKVRKLYQRAKADDRFDGEFEEFLFNWEEENLLLEREWTRITERH